MDELDNIIISELELDGRKPFTEIAKKLNLSEGTIRKRVEKLVKEGKIKFTVIITTKIGFSAIVMIKTSPQMKTSSIVESIKKIKEVKEVYEVAGDADIIVRISCNNAEEFNEIIDEIRSIPNVLETKTYTILKISYPR
jgi:Transcriptional regulators